MGEIGTDENFGDKTGGDRPREHCNSFLTHRTTASGVHLVFIPSDLVGSSYWSAKNMNPDMTPFGMSLDVGLLLRNKIIKFYNKH